MTAREAQTLDGCIRKMNNILIQMRKRGVNVKTRTDLGFAIQATVDTVVNAGRMEEISPRSLRSQEALELQACRCIDMLQTEMCLDCEIEQLDRDRWGLWCPKCHRAIKLLWQ